MTVRACVDRILALFRARSLERDLNDEIQNHIELAASENMRRGMRREAALEAARRSFGSAAAMRDEYREQQGVAFLENLLRDLRLAVRTLRRHGQFTAVASGILALGIAAVTAVSGFYHQIVLRPLPFQSPEELVMLWTTIPSQKIEEDGSAYLNIVDWKQQNRSFRDLALVSRFEPATLTGGDEPEEIRAGRVSANLFPLLGVAPALGRTFTQAEEDRRDRVVVLSHRFWQNRFGGSPGVIGRTIRTTEGTSVVIGVMPPEFRFPSKDIEFWEPHTVAVFWPQVKQSRGSDLYKVVARLRPGISVESAQASMDMLAQRIATQTPDVPKGLGVRLVPLTVQLTGRTLPVALSLLFAAVLGILLIACTNVAGLLLARGAGRSREFAVRAAIGGGRWRLVQQLMVESVVLGTAASMAGVLAGAAGIRLIERFLPLDLPHIDQIPLNVPVLAFSFCLGLATVVACGIFPALNLSGTAPNSALKGAGGRVSSSGAVRRMLVTGESAVATVLVIGTLLLLQSFRNVQRTEAGFDSERVLTIRVTLPASYNRDRGAAFFQQAVERLKALPGVASAGGIHELFYQYNADTVITIEGKAPPDPGQPLPQLIGDAVVGDYFQAMQVPLIKGRLPGPQDTGDRPAMAAINETMARTFFPGEDPVGKRFTFGRPAPGQKTWWVTVSGVVGDMRRQGLEAPVVSQMFGNISQFGNTRMDLVVRINTEPAQLQPAIRETLRNLERGAIVGTPMPVKDGLARFQSWRRFQTWLLSAFALVALLLATLGIYGLLQQMLAQRRKEIAIRMAIGARPADVQLSIFREALMLVCAGLLVGAPVALAGAGSIRSLLFGVSPNDTSAILVTVLTIILTACAASLLPARRVARMEPNVILREE